MEPWFSNLICSKKPVREVILFESRIISDWSYRFQHERVVRSRTEVLFNNQDIFFHELLGQELNWSRLETFKHWGLIIFSFHVGYAGEYHKIHAAVCLVFLAQCDFVFLWRLFDRPRIWNTVSLKKISLIGKIWSLEKHRTKDICRKNGIKILYGCDILH